MYKRLSFEKQFFTTTCKAYPMIEVQGMGRKILIEKNTVDKDSTETAYRNRTPLQIELSKHAAAFWKI